MSARITTTRQSDLLALHRMGLPPSRIADRLGTSVAYIRQALAALGVTPHRQRRPAGFGPRPMRLDDYRTARVTQQAERRAAIAALVAADPEISSRALARRFGVSAATVIVDRRALGCAAPSTRSHHTYKED